MFDPLTPFGLGIVVFGNFLFGVVVGYNTRRHIEREEVEPTNSPLSMLPPHLRHQLTRHLSRREIEVYLQSSVRMQKAWEKEADLRELQAKLQERQVIATTSGMRPLASYRNYSSDKPGRYSL